MGSSKIQERKQKPPTSGNQKNRFTPFFSSFCRGLEELIFPPICILCEQSIECDYKSPLYCQPCLEKIWLPTDSACYRCSARTPYKYVGSLKVPIINTDATHEGCQSCHKRDWKFDRAVAVGIYETELRRHLYNLKQPLKLTEAYQAGLLLGHKLQLQLDSVRLSQIEALIPIPIHWKRWFTRQFNQAEQIALGISEITGIPVEKNALKQSKFRKKQGTLTAAGRIQNVKATLRIGKAGSRIRGKRVLLVDDVMTTGATLTAAAEILTRKLKPASIDVAIVARASLV